MDCNARSGPAEGLHFAVARFLGGEQEAEVAAGLALVVRVGDPALEVAVTATHDARPNEIRIRFEVRINTVRIRSKALPLWSSGLVILPLK